LKYFIPEQDIWFHVDKVRSALSLARSLAFVHSLTPWMAYMQLSSPHIYLRMPEGMEWDKIPEKLLLDAGQLVKAGSIQVRTLSPVS